MIHVGDTITFTIDRQEYELSFDTREQVSTLMAGLEMVRQNLRETGIEQWCRQCGATIHCECNLAHQECSDCASKAKIQNDGMDKAAGK